MLGVVIWLSLPNSVGSMPILVLFCFLIFIYLFWLCQVLVAAHGIFVVAYGILRRADFLVAPCELLVVTCMWDLVPRPGIEPRPPSLGTQSTTHWTTREVPRFWIRALTAFMCVCFSPFLCFHFLHRKIMRDAEQTYELGSQIQLNPVKLSWEQPKPSWPRDSWGRGKKRCFKPLEISDYLLHSIFAAIADIMHFQ